MAQILPELKKNLHKHCLHAHTFFHLWIGNLNKPKTYLSTYLCDSSDICDSCDSSDSSNGSDSNDTSDRSDSSDSSDRSDSSDSSDKKKLFSPKNFFHQKNSQKIMIHRNKVKSDKT